jgi:hypothetical protein
MHCFKQKKEPVKKEYCMHVKITNIIELAGNVKEPQRLQEKLLKFILLIIIKIIYGSKT